MIRNFSYQHAPQPRRLEDSIMQNAINLTLLATVAALVLLVSNHAIAAPDFDEDYYNECTLKNLKPGLDRAAIQLIQQACKHKATPKKCRALVGGGLDLLAPDPFGEDARRKCVEACKNEGYYSRTFGDCSTG
jgi:hypothetical protein